MSILKHVVGAFSPEDPVLVQRTLARIAEQDTWNDVFSTKLIELLDNIDGLKHDLRERMRRIESVTRAESALLDEATRTESLNTKLAETEQALNQVRQELEVAKSRHQGADQLRREAEAIFVEAEKRYREAWSLAENAVLEYRKAQEDRYSSASAYKGSAQELQRSSSEYHEANRLSVDARSSLDTASERLRRAECAQALAYQFTLEAQQSLDQSTFQQNDARSMQERATGYLDAAGQNFSRYRKRRISVEEALRNFGERGVLAVVAGGAGWAAAALLHGSLIGIPVSMVTRLLGGQFFHNRHRRELLDQYISVVLGSRRCLELQLPRPLLVEARFN